MRERDAQMAAGDAQDLQLQKTHSFDFAPHVNPHPVPVLQPQEAAKKLVAKFGVMMYAVARGKFFVRV